MENIPENVIFEIQLRLPVKSLLRFKCVSKSWKACFHSQRFIESHFVKQKDLDGDNFDNSTILLFRQTFQSLDPTFIFVTEIEECNSTLTAKENIRIPFPNIDHNWRITGQCMGVICLYNKEKVALWNPATREFKLLPRVDRPKDTFCYSTVGFGYDHTNADFKVVRYRDKPRKQKILDALLKKIKILDTSIIEVYSLNHNRWREIPNETKRYAPICPSVFINGLCHWAEYNETGQSFIVSFDVTKETFRTTRVAFGDGHSFMVFPVSEYLGMGLASAYDISCFDIWKLKNLDDTASWTKQELNILDDFLEFWKNGQVFTSPWHVTDDMLLYDPNTGNDRILDSCIGIDIQTQNLGCCGYVQSLYQIQGRSEEKEGIHRTMLPSPAAPLS